MYKFKIVKLKNFILPFILVFFTICLVVFSNSNLKAAKNGLVLWANSVVPSLLSSGSVNLIGVIPVNNSGEFTFFTFCHVPFATNFSSDSPPEYMSESAIS